MPADKFPDAGDAAADTLATLLRPSKTRRKHDSHALQELGLALTELPESRLETLPMAESLRDAIRAWKQTRTHEGKRRQMQYIGKLMRGADVEPLREAVTELQLGRAHDSLALHQAERWRAELLASDDAATRWLAEHPGADAQQLRSLVRSVRKDAALVPERRSGRAFRELFRFVREHADGHAAEADAPTEGASVPTEGRR
jgi:ribosome-associated protein